MLSMFKGKKGFSVLFEDRSAEDKKGLPISTPPLPSGHTGRHFLPNGHLERCQRCGKSFPVAPKQPAITCTCPRCDYPICRFCREPQGRGDRWVCCTCAQSFSLMKLLEKTRYGNDIVVRIMRYCDPRAQRILRMFFQAAALQIDSEVESVSKGISSSGGGLLQPNTTLLNRLLSGSLSKSEIATGSGCVRSITLSTEKDVASLSCSQDFENFPPQHMHPQKQPEEYSPPQPVRLHNVSLNSTTPYLSEEVICATHLNFSQHAAYGDGSVVREINGAGEAGYCALPYPHTERQRDETASKLVRVESDLTSVNHTTMCHSVSGVFGQEELLTGCPIHANRENVAGEGHMEHEGIALLSTRTTIATLAAPLLLEPEALNGSISTCGGNPDSEGSGRSMSPPPRFPPFTQFLSEQQDGHSTRNYDGLVSVSEDAAENVLELGVRRISTKISTTRPVLVESSLTPRQTMQPSAALADLSFDRRRVKQSTPCPTRPSFHTQHSARATPRRARDNPLIAPPQGQPASGPRIVKSARRSCTPVAPEMTLREEAGVQGSHGHRIHVAASPGVSSSELEGLRGSRAALCGTRVILPGSKRRSGSGQRERVCEGSGRKQAKMRSVREGHTSAASARLVRNASANAKSFYRTITPSRVFMRVCSSKAVLPERSNMHRAATAATNTPPNPQRRLTRTVSAGAGATVHLHNAGAPAGRAPIPLIRSRTAVPRVVQIPSASVHLDLNNSTRRPAPSARAPTAASALAAQVYTRTTRTPLTRTVSAPPPAVPRLPRKATPLAPAPFPSRLKRTYSTKAAFTRFASGRPQPETPFVAPKVPALHFSGARFPSTTDPANGCPTPSRPLIAAAPPKSACAAGPKFRHPCSLLTSGGVPLGGTAATARVGCAASLARATGFTPVTPFRSRTTPKNKTVNQSPPVCNRVHSPRLLIRTNTRGCDEKQVGALAKGDGAGAHPATTTKPLTYTPRPALGQQARENSNYLTPLRHADVSARGGGCRPPLSGLSTPSTRRKQNFSGVDNSNILSTSASKPASRRATSAKTFARLATPKHTVLLTSRTAFYKDNSIKS